MKRIVRAVFLALVAGVVAGPLWWQRQQTIGLREEIGSLRDQDRELAQLQAENSRLRQGRISPDALESLRADHTAIVRLREQIEKLKTETREGAR